VTYRSVEERNLLQRVSMPVTNRSQEGYGILGISNTSVIHGPKISAGNSSLVIMCIIIWGDEEEKGMLTAQSIECMWRLRVDSYLKGQKCARIYPRGAIGV
jgi:hypothetical protein